MALGSIFRRVGRFWGDSVKDAKLLEDAVADGFDRVNPHLFGPWNDVGPLRSNYTAKPWDFVRVDQTGGAVKVGIPAPSVSRAWIAVKSVSDTSNAIAVNSIFPGVTIDGGTSKTVSARGGLLLKPVSSTQWESIGTSASAAAGGTSALTNFDDRNNPVVLYNFDQGATTSLVNLGTAGSAANLSVELGTETYGDLFPGKGGFYFNGSTRLLAGASSSLVITGDITVLLMLQRDRDAPAGAFVFALAGATESEADNALASLIAIVAETPPRRMRWISENGAGINSEVDTVATFSFPPVHNISWIGLSKSGTTVSFYYNGRFVSSGSITAVTGGTNARLRVGGNVGLNTSQSLMYGFKLLDQAYDAPEMAAEYNYTMGGAFGEAV
jgi:hypothetical protein